MFKKNKDPKKKVPNEKVAPMEFNERVSRLLMVCIEGMCKMIPEKEALYATLKNLGEVVKKATRPKPLTGLAKEIEDFFTRLNLESRFRRSPRSFSVPLCFGTVLINSSNRAIFSSLVCASLYRSSASKYWAGRFVGISKSPPLKVKHKEIGTSWSPEIVIDIAVIPRFN